MADGGYRVILLYRSQVHIFTITRLSYREGIQTRRRNQTDLPYELQVAYAPDSERKGVISANRQETDTLGIWDWLIVRKVNTL